VTAVLNKSAAVLIMDCSPAVISAGVLASAWNVPVVAFGAATPTLSDKATYNTVVRTFHPFSIVGDGIANILQFYKWSTVGVLMELQNNPQFAYLVPLQVTVLDLCFN
jgi:hypothetical protein